MVELEERYTNTLEYIEALGSSKSVLGLERIREVLNVFDNPQDKLNVVHIAGTNGKGSTVMMLSNIYKEAGYQVGTFISPEVVDFRERIQYNCRFIEKEMLCDIVEEMKEKIELGSYKITHFEFVTVIAFLYFVRKQCDIVFLEVGLGGRLDATNVISKPLVSVLTLIDYDHMAILGKDLASIAKEKCGIIKPNSDVVSYPYQEKEVMDVIMKKCTELHNTLHIPETEKIEILNTSEFHQELRYKSKEYRIGLNGTYQINNTITVLEVVEVLRKKGYPCSYEKVYKGINNTTFPGRLEVIAKKPTIIADGAHNEAGIKVLMQTVNNIVSDRKIAIVSILEDKEIKVMTEIFAPCFDRIIIVPIHMNRGASIEYIKQQVMQKNMNVECIEDYKEALEKAKEYATKRGIIYIFGSLYLIKDIRKQVNKIEKDD